jgi:hypothetical protein
MSLLVPSASQQTMLQRVLGQKLLLKLYTNGRTPALGDVAADYTEMAGIGYMAKTLAAGNWSYLPGPPTKAVYLQQVWTFQAGGPIKVYGYYVVQASDGKLLWAERFLPAGSLPIDYFVEQNEGDQIVIGTDVYPIQCTLGSA